MERDVIRELGPLAFASRLKRLSERLQQDVSRVYREQEVDFEARWFPVAFLLRDGQPRSVTEIADALELTHPAVSQIVGAMELHALVDTQRDSTDERRRLITLSEVGLATLASLEPIWNAVAVCTQELIGDGKEFLDKLGSIERSLQERDMYARVMATVHQQMLDQIDIIDYDPQYRQYFGSLNREWLEEYFEVEAHDAAVLDDPEGTILRLGGEIVFARRDGEIVGTAALLRGPNQHYELAKMGVARRARGHQVGRKLAMHMIARARELGARELVLATSPKLTPAISLYRSLGFDDYEPNPAWRAQYKRPSIFMKLDLSAVRTPEVTVNANRMKEKHQ